jgi:rhodanese-related sulfurtransferase
METILVKDGDVIVRQGDAGDFYYVLTEGGAQVTRTVELATLKAGASFGEEALVADTKRNATITMTSDGMLMRLSKDDFNELLREPLLNRVSPEEARQRVSDGAVWLDVRHAKEYHHSHLPKAVNIPLHELRMRMAELDKNQHYVCYCGTGRRSSAAAFLLVQRGYQASVLNGGVQVMAQDLQR